MPDDPFGDLGPGRGERRDPARPGGPADRLSELDERDLEREAPTTPHRPRSRYTWVVGVAALILIIAAAWNSLFNVGAGEGFRGPEPGSQLPEFAAPAPTSDLEGNANIIQREDAASSDAPPACEVTGPDIVTVCDPQEPLVVTFVTTGCEQALDVVETVRGDFPEARFVAVYSGESSEEIAELVASNGWGLDVAVDPDRPEIFNLYRAGDCPTTVLASEGGEVERTILGPLPEEELRAAVAAIGEDRRGGDAR